MITSELNNILSAQGLNQTICSEWNTLTQDQQEIVYGFIETNHRPGDFKTFFQKLTPMQQLDLAAKLSRSNSVNPIILQQMAELLRPSEVEEIVGGIPPTPGFVSVRGFLIQTRSVPTYEALQIIALANRANQDVYNAIFKNKSLLTTAIISRFLSTCKDRVTNEILRLVLNNLPNKIWNYSDRSLQELNSQSPVLINERIEIVQAILTCRQVNIGMVDELLTQYGGRLNLTSLMQNPGVASDIPLSMLRRLSGFTETVNRGSLLADIARHPNADSELLLAIFNDLAYPEQGAEWILSHANANKGVLLAVLNHQPPLPIAGDNLLRLALDPRPAIDNEVRQAILNHPNMTEIRSAAIRERYFNPKNMP